MTDQQQESPLNWGASAEVIKADPDRVEACVASHPGEPCPGWPHPENEETP